MIKEILLVFFFQLAFNVLKVLEIKYTYENKIKALLFNTVWINLVSLGGFYFSLDSLFKGHFWIVLVYIAGSILGKWIAMTKIENIRGKIFTLFSRRG